MTAEITFSQLWANPSLLGFFFRKQSEWTLRDLMDRAVDSEKACEAIDDYAEMNGYDLDAIEELFYEEPAGRVADECGIELAGEGDEDGDEDEDED